MHISDGYLHPVVALGGYAVTGIVTTAVISKFREDDLPRTAVMSSLFFAASAISIPLPPFGSVHLLLAGLLGIVLGWQAFPAIFTALLLQLLMLGYGGPLALGVNTLNLACGAVAAHYFFRFFLGPDAPGPSARRVAAGFGAGIVGALVAGLCFFLSLLSIEDTGIHYAVRYVILMHVPILAVEAVITAQAVLFLARVKPDLLCRRIL